eukprot:IDg20066t1
MHVIRSAPCLDMLTDAPEKDAQHALNGIAVGAGRYDGTHPPITSHFSHAQLAAREYWPVQHEPTRSESGRSGRCVARAQAPACASSACTLVAQRIGRRGGTQGTSNAAAPAGIGWRTP